MYMYSFTDLLLDQCILCFLISRTFDCFNVCLICCLLVFIFSLLLRCHSPEIIKAYHDAIPLNRYGSEREIGEVIFFLSSAKASFVTGQTLAADGGFEATYKNIYVRDGIVLVVKNGVVPDNTSIGSL